jgi:hypothetical protein
MKKNLRKLKLARETVHNLGGLQAVRGGLTLPVEDTYHFTVWNGPRYSETCSCNCSYSICEWC